MERVDLPLALHNQPQRHRLHSPRAQTALHLVPQQRRNLIPHQPVQNPPRLLRIHQILIHVPCMEECRPNRLLRDLVERHPLQRPALLHRGQQLHLQVRRNRLPFAIRIRRQKHRVRLGRQLFQPVHNLLLARRHNQRRLKRPVLQLHANVVLRQVHDVANRGLHHVIAAQVLINRLRLRGRLDNHQ